LKMKMWLKSLGKGWVKRILDILSGVIITSGLVDLVLWFQIEALIPSWTMFATAVASVALMQVVREML